MGIYYELTDFVRFIVWERWEDFRLRVGIARNGNRQRSGSLFEGLMWANCCS